MTTHFIANLHIEYNKLSSLFTIIILYYYRMVLTRWLTMSSILFVLVANVSCLQDEFMEEAQRSCMKTRNSYSCLKYRTLKYVTSIVDKWPSTVTPASNTSSVRLVHMQEDLEEDTGLLEDSRQLDTDTELQKIVKFVKRHAKHFLMSHGVSVDLPAGARAVGEDGDEIFNHLDEARSGAAANPRGKRKKLAILLPFLSLISLLKVKLLLLPILLSVFFIKKLLILAALFLPTILSTLKVCKVPHAGHHQHQWGGVEAAPEYTSGYGAPYSSYGVAPAPVYSKDWAASRAYNGYKTLMKPNDNNNMYANSPMSS